MNFAVTGANGFVGNHLSAVLSQRGHGVNACIRAMTNKNKALSRVVVPSINASTDWSVALQGVDYVIHLAARVHIMSDSAEDSLAEFRKVNLDGTLHLARSAIAAGVKRYVFMSSVKVNGESTQPGHVFTEQDAANPQDPYAISKNEAEEGLRQIASESGLEVVIIRPPLVYGSGVKANFAALMRAVQKGWPLPLGAIHNKRSLIGIDNLVDFILTCITHPKAANQTFLVSDGHDLSTTELVRELSIAAGVSDRTIDVPVWALRVAGKLFGKSDSIDRLCDNLQVDISKARNLLGWNPPVSVQEGLHRAFSGMLNP